MTNIQMFISEGYLMRIMRGNSACKDLQFEGCFNLIDLLIGKHKDS